MASTKFEQVAVRGVVTAVPGDPIDIRQLGGAFDAGEVEKIAKTVGLAHVHRVDTRTTAGDLCVAAAERLLADLDWPRESVDGIIMVTQTPDHFLPATACVAHGTLGLADGCFAFDVGLGCSGYVYGLWMASQFIAGGSATRVLVLAGDTISRTISPEDKSVAMLFGDAGSATAVERDPSAEPVAFVLGTDGRGSANLSIPAGGFRERPGIASSVRATDESGSARAPAELYMDGLAIFNFTLQRVPELVRGTLCARGWEMSDVDAFLFHQANGFILGKIGKKLGIAPERAPVNIQRYGNTSMASIPLLLTDDMRDAVRGDAPMRVVLAGFGVGYSWAGAALSLSRLASASVIRV